MNDKHVPNDEFRPSINHCPLLVEDMFLLMSLNNVVFLHLF